MQQNNTDCNSDHRSLSLRPASHSDTGSYDLISYLEILVRNWRMILKATTTAAVLFITISLSLPNIYSATAKILPPQQISSDLMGVLLGAAGGMGGMAADLLGKGTSADFYVGILNSDTISDRIIDRFSLIEVYKQKYRVSTYKALHKNLNISAGKKDGIISITVEDKNPKLATDIANAFVDELAILTIKMSSSSAGQNRTFYEERLTKARADLAKAEDGLKSFQGKNKALDITEQAKGTIKGVADLEAQLAMEEVKLSGLRQSLTDNSQEVKSQLAVIANIKSQIAKFEGNRRGASIPGVGSVPELGQQYLRLMREFKIQETLVELLTKQYEIAKLSEAKESTSIQVIQAARVPDRKTKPKRALLVLMGTFITLFFAVVYAFLKEHIAKLSDEEKNRLLMLKSQLPISNFKNLLIWRLKA